MASTRLSPVLQNSYVNYGESDFDVPTIAGQGGDASPVCSGTPYKVPNSGFSSESAEQAWAEKSIASMLAANPSCLQHSSSGDFAVLKPSNRQTVYAEGWSPSYTASHPVTRVLKAEYLFAPYAPTDAILTGCTLELDSSTTVTTSPGSDPTLASVHSNCTINTQGNPTVTGQVSSTGTGSGQSNKFTDPLNVGGNVTNTPAENIPSVTASQVWSENALANANAWYDMCPDGTVRVPTAGLTPCDKSNPIWPNGTLSKGAGQFNGFQWESTDANGIGTWNLINGAADGTYYFYDSSVYPGKGLGNPSSGAVTIIASSPNTTSCPRQGGTIEWDHDDFATPAITNLFMMADNDIITDSNFHAGGPSSGSAGEFLAGDQINMQTSSQGAYGSVIAEDSCPGVSPYTDDVVKNPAIYYDPNASAPFTSIIDTTLWLELTQ